MDNKEEYVIQGTIARIKIKGIVGDKINRVYELEVNSEKIIDQQFKEKVFHIGKDSKGAIYIPDKKIPIQAVSIIYSLDNGWEVKLAEKNAKLDCFVEMKDEKLLPYRLEKDMVFDVIGTQFKVTDLKDIKV